VLISFPADLVEKARGSLVTLGVQVKSGAMVKHVDKAGLTIESDNQTDSILRRQ
jgi:NADH dehydrogenase FAD-containing subunit